MKVTFAQLRTSLGRQLNVCSDGTGDATLLDYLNRALERLWYMPGVQAVYARYRVCVNEACITWPRELETIEGAILDDLPLTIRNSWYEFIGNGPGNIANDNSRYIKNLIDRGDSFTFDNVRGSGNRLAVYCDGAEDTTSAILIRYYNSSGSKVYKQHGDVVDEGEYISLPAAGAYSYSSFLVNAGGIYGVVKPPTNYMIRLYEHNPTTGNLRPLAYYEPKELVPTYRNSLVPGLDPGDCAARTMIVMGRRRFVPIQMADDIVPIEHPDAIRLAVQAIREEESSLKDDAAKSWALAKQALEDQGRHQKGRAVDQPMKVRRAPWIAAPRNVI